MKCCDHISRGQTHLHSVAAKDSVPTVGERYLQLSVRLALKFAHRLYLILALQILRGWHRRCQKHQRTSPRPGLIQVTLQPQPSPRHRWRPPAAVVPQALQRGVKLRTLDLQTRELRAI